MDLPPWFEPELECSGSCPHALTPGVEGGTVDQISLMSPSGDDMAVHLAVATNIHLGSSVSARGAGCVS